jgi:hypothetical protein
MESVNSLGLSDGSEQSCHLAVAIHIGLHGEGDVPLVGLGLSDEAVLEVFQGLHSFNPRDFMRNQLCCLRAANRAMLRFIGG